MRFWLPRFLETSAYAYVVCAICLAPIAVAAIFVRYKAFVLGCSAIVGGLVAMFAAYTGLPIGHGGGNIDVDALLLGAMLVGMFIGSVVGLVFCLLARIGRIPESRNSH